MTDYILVFMLKATDKNSWLSLTAVVLVTILIYLPGLDSPFFLDDFMNLVDLAEIRDRGLGFYLFGNSSGPTGRPLSLLSFALQYESWPADPLAFKAVNLFLHLINGGLIFILSIKLMPFLSERFSANRTLPLLVTMVWLLHPIQLTTVLYVVQRMTILASLFMLMGMLVYLSCRRSHTQHTPRMSFIAMSGVYLFTGLSVLCKEIGILLPLYILVMEYTVFHRRESAVWRARTVPFLLLPLLIFMVYLFIGFEGIIQSYSIREFTPVQRLFTQVNVLMDYLRLIVIPFHGGFSLFNDDYLTATGLFSPWHTWLNLVFIIMVVSLSLFSGRRYRVAGFAILWFFSGHILESSFIGLELYFEHRNYLPSFGIVFLVCWAMFSTANFLNSRFARFGVRYFYLVLVVAVTCLEISIWNRPLLQAAEWVRQHPESKRALDHEVNMNLVYNQHEKVITGLERLLDIDPLDIYPHIKKITIAYCYRQQSLSSAEWQDIIEFARQSKFRGMGFYSEFFTIEYQLAHGNCKNMNHQNLDMLVDALISNPDYVIVYDRLHESAAMFALTGGRVDKAINHLEKAVEMTSKIDNEVILARLLIETGNIQKASDILQQINRQLQFRPGRRQFYKATMQQLNIELSEKRRLSE